MIRRLPAPIAREASMNSRSLSASTWPRTTRATPIQPNRASSRMMKRIEVRSPMIGSSQGISPSMLRITSRATRNGKARKMSVTRISTSSNQPPRNAGEGADGGADDHAMMAAASPMASDTRVP